MLEPLLTVGIATKGRPEVLDQTLRKLHAFGLGGCPLILFDDGSTPAINPPALSLFQNARVIRVAESVGQALGRNRICEAVVTPYVLQLDDDSYPIEGDLGDLLKVVSNAENWLAIAIPFEEPSKRRWPTGVPHEDLFPVRSFVGCSALLHVENFRRLGGYAPWIHRTCEEDELTLRGWNAGLSTFSINLLTNRHDVTDVGRSLSGITYRSFRNWLLVWALRAPGSVLPTRIIRLIGASIIHSVKHRDLAALKGIIAALRVLPSLLNHRAPLTLAAYRHWRHLPHALDYLKAQPAQVLPSPTI